MATVLEAGAITKTYAGVRALRSVSFELRSGEVHALIGENGAGKSTLIKVITGAVQPDSGSLRVHGQPVLHMKPPLSRSLGIAAIYQQPSLFPDLSVAENIALALEGGAPWRRVDWQQRRSNAVQLLARAGSNLDPDRAVASLSMPEQQIVEIAKAIGADARIVIMDEPTASLTGREVESLFQVVRQMRDHGTAIIYISHRLDEIEEIADRVTVLRDGETVATHPIAGVNREQLISMMVGREVAAIFPKRDITLGDVVLELRDLSCQSGGVRNVSLNVRRGEILGIAGLVGSGRTELARTIFGLTPATAGDMIIGGVPVRIGSPQQAIRLGIGYVPEDRRQHGVVLEMPIAANTTLASLQSVSRYGMIQSPRERDVAQRFLDQLRIKAPSVDTAAGALSGGNQQKVALARWLAIEPSVLILDEPTQGVDVGSKSEIHNLMVEMAARGMAILMISSELPELLGMSDRIAVMRGGSISGILNRSEATQQRILALALQQSRATA